METRSRELPLTAAKPIYLRPRSLLPSRFSLVGSRSRSRSRSGSRSWRVPVRRDAAALQPVYKEDRVSHGDISLSRVPVFPCSRGTEIEERVVDTRSTTKLNSLVLDISVFRIGKNLLRQRDRKDTDEKKRPVLFALCTNCDEREGAKRRGG